MTTNTNTRPNRINASHANCSHANTKSDRAKCRRAMRASTQYDALRNDPTTSKIDAASLLANASANNDPNQMSIDEIESA